MGDDLVFGDAGEDILDGFHGADSLYGGLGDDMISNQIGNSQLVGGRGFDALSGGDGGDLLDAGADDDTLDGGNGLDWLLGGSGDDLMLGGAGSDTLTGGSGDDTLHGGGKRDVLTGGSGADDFVFAAQSESGTTANTRDTITDFKSGTDQVDLSAMDANTVLAGDQAFIYLGSGAYTGVAGQLQYSVATGLLKGDTNGDAISDFVIELATFPLLVAGDLIL